MLGAMRPLLWALALTASLLSGCTVKLGEDADAGAGDLDAAGGAGGDDAGADAAGDAADDGADALGPCGDVPVTGRCKGATTIEACFIPEYGAPGSAVAPPRVTTRTCLADTTCVDAEDGAHCVTSGTCQEGESLCKTANSVQICTGGAWVETTCGSALCKQKPGFGAVCGFDSPSGSGPVLRGRLQYERRRPKPDLTGFGDVSLDDARGVVVTVYDGSTFLGAGTTDPADGTFAVELSQAATDTTFAYFFPMLFDEQGRILLAVAKWGANATPDDLDASEYWTFGAQLAAGQTDIGTQVVSEAAGSGALHIFEWMLYGITQARALEPSVKPQSLLALWAPDAVFGCGNGPQNGTACFYNNAASGGGVNVAYTGGMDHFDSAIAVPGTTASPKHWSTSVLLHELGHWVMDTYSRAPGVGGAHTLTDVEAPSMAWSEGYATFHGQSTYGAGLYFTKSTGTSWWFDIDKFDSSSAVSIPTPNPSGPLDQHIGEVFVASSMWHLWSDASVEQSTTWESVSVPTQRVWDALSSAHLTSKAKYGRGFPGPDLVDWLDAMECLGTPAADLDTVLGHYGFPYDHGAVCP